MSLLQKYPYCSAFRGLIALWISYFMGCIELMERHSVAVTLFALQFALVPRFSGLLFAGYGMEHCVHVLR